MSAKTFTGGRSRSARVYLDLLRHHLGAAQGAAENAYNLFRRTDDLGGDRVLEIGCGTRAGATLLHHTHGNRVTGIDYDHVGFGWRVHLRTLRDNGLERAAKTLVRRHIFDRAYYRELARLLGCPLRFDADLRRMDARKLDFPDGEFDVVYSVAVFEHIDGVDQAAAELARVLKPSGRASVSVHLYPSLSGGHVLSWADPRRPPKSPPPWDHLRDRTQPAHVYLNRLRGDDYLEAFDRHLTIDSYSYATEGEELVTEAIVRETGYGRDDLVRRTLRLMLSR
jgi:SAM-dependent methyltransferase